MSANTVIDVDEAQFDQEVVEHSRTQPVVVDFWAEWCGPCRTLGPMLEQAVEARAGAVRLVKVDVDANQRLAQRYQVRGIPAVKGFRDGEVVAEFVGAVGPPQIEAFLDQLGPSAADEAVREARELLPDDPDAAIELVKPHLPHPGAEEVTAQAELLRAGIHDEEDLERHVEELLGKVERGEDRDAAREELVNIFTALGDEHPLVQDARPRLARALF